MTDPRDLATLVGILRRFIRDGYPGTLNLDELVDLAATMNRWGDITDDELHILRQWADAICPGDPTNRT